MAHKTIGELNGKWALIFKATQIMWAVLLPIMLVVMTQWAPWVTNSTILNNQYREGQPTVHQQLVDQLKSDLVRWHYETQQGDLTEIKKELAALKHLLDRRAVPGS